MSFLCSEESIWYISNGHNKWINLIWWKNNEDKFQQCLKPYQLQKQFVSGTCFYILSCEVLNISYYKSFTSSLTFLLSKDQQCMIVCVSYMKVCCCAVTMTLESRCNNVRNCAWYDKPREHHSLSDPGPTRIEGLSYSPKPVISFFPRRIQNRILSMPRVFTELG